MDLSEADQHRIHAIRAADLARMSALERLGPLRLAPVSIPSTRNPPDASAAVGTSDPTVGPVAPSAAGPADLLEAIRSTGVEGQMADHLAELVRACADVGGTPPTSSPAGSAASSSTVTPAAALASSTSPSDGPDVDRARTLLTAVEKLIGATARIDGMALEATRQLTIANGRLLLADKQISDPEELSSTARNRWRARAKSVTRAEIAAATGWGAGEVSDLVATATAPAAVLGPVLSALRSSVAPWRLIRSYRRACAGLAHEDASAIAETLFGSNPETVATERVSAAGELTDAPWHVRDFYRALDREVAQHTRATPAQERRTKQRVLAASDLRVTADADGTASIQLICSITQAAAIHDRVDSGARLIRKAGDPRPLNQLRTAVTTALLLHGTVNNPPDAPPQTGSETTITVPTTAQMDRIMAGLPAATINVIVPIDTLLPRAAGAATCRHHGCTAPFDSAPATTRPAATGPAATRPNAGEPTTGPPGIPGTGPHSTSAPPGAEVDPPPPYPPGADPDTPGIAEVTGSFPHFITGAQARELALFPGSTLHRLVTDPLTGRCLERSTTAYRFDQRMRDQIAAADLMCRAPGCHAPARTCEFDHVEEFGTDGGSTRESNGALLHGHHHQTKTDKAWDVVIGSNREMTWTTLLGRIYATKAHDYRQYDALVGGHVDRLERMCTQASVSAADAPQAEATADAMDSAIYAALTRRDSGQTLTLSEDVDEPVAYPSWELITLTHRDDQGRLRYEPRPDVARAERGPSTSGTSANAQTDAADVAAAAPRTGAAGVAPARRIASPRRWRMDPDAPPPF